MQFTITTTIFGLPTGQRLEQVRLTLPSTTLTVHDLIAYKVQQEVQEYLAQQRPGISGESRSPEELTRAATGAVPIIPGSIADEVSLAQQAFAARAYMIVANEQRLWHLDDVLTIQPNTSLECIKILPLVGG